MLTAIVVGVATLAVGLALVVRIREVYGTIEDDEIDNMLNEYFKEEEEEGKQTHGIQNNGDIKRKRRRKSKRAKLLRQ